MSEIANCIVCPGGDCGCPGNNDHPNCSCDECGCLQCHDLPDGEANEVE